MKVIHAPYNNQEDLDTAYDHANTPTVSGVTDTAAAPINQKILQYYTQIKGKREQDITIACTQSGPFLDYIKTTTWKYIEERKCLPI